MTGPELKRLMKARRLKTVEVARALDVHPQTIRNLWLKEEVPRIYLMAMAHYAWAQGLPAIEEPAKMHIKADGRWRTVKTEPVSKPAAKPVENREDIWNRLKSPT